MKMLHASSTQVIHDNLILEMMPGRKEHAPTIDRSHFLEKAHQPGV